MLEASFQPSATLDTLRKRAELLQRLRAFFQARGVLEVDVPVLGYSTVTDVFIESLTTHVDGKTAYLQTSPEFYMKRLLAAGSGSIYYLGKSFRRDERGQRHRAEFMMLEWYRTGFDDQQLMDEVVELLLMLQPAIKITQRTYGEVFAERTGINPHSATVAELRNFARRHYDVQWQSDDKAVWLDLLFTHAVEPALTTGVSLIFDYPASHCALARLSQDSKQQRVAKRFEVFWEGMELANGYWELTDAQEQERRFRDDLLRREAAGLPTFAYDEKLLAALRSGLPECAGVAMGVDRLLMCVLGKRSIAEVMPFAEG